MKTKSQYKALSHLIPLFFASALLAQSQWSAHSDSNNAIIRLPFINQDSPAVAKDGANGAIITWVDKNNLDIYAQRIDEAGRIRWEAAGRPVALGDEEQKSPTVITDSKGNVFVAWLDRSNLFNDAEVRVQKFNSDGAPQWPSPENPKATVAHRGEHSAPLILLNETSEIITASYSTFGINDLILGQIIDAIDGTERFDFDQGTVNPNAKGRQPDQPPAVVSALNGGMIACWADARPKMGVVAIGLLGNGASWSRGETVVSDTVSTNTYPRTISDGSHGAIIAWIEPGSIVGNDLIKAARVDSSGKNVWGTNEVEINTTFGVKENLKIIPDGQNSAYIIWELSNITSDLYIQRLSNQDGSSWSRDTKISALTGKEPNAEITVNGEGTAIVAWQDNPNGDFDIFTQFISAAGNRLFSDPIATATANGDQQNPILVDDRHGGAVVVWQDFRAGDSDIYAQRVNVKGTLGEFRTIELTSPSGNETFEIGSSQIIRWTASEEITNVKIELSRDGGKNYAAIEEATANDGVYIFKVIGPPSDSSKIRISAVTTDFLVDVSEAFFTISAQEGPRLTHTPKTSGTAGEKIEINTNATDFSGVARVTLNYRKGGASTFVAAPMTQQTPGQFLGTIPANSVTERGLEYFIGSIDNIDISTITDTFHVSISFGPGVETTGTPSGSEQTSYRMISAPNTLDQPLADSIFAISGFGVYDTTSWRLFGYRDGKNVERDSMNALSFRFEKGRSYWVISSQSRTVDFGPGVSLRADTSTAINLSPGWNQIGQPFAFRVAWNAVTSSGDVSAPFLYEEQYMPAAALEPYGGYFVYNFENGDITLTIPPIESEAANQRLAKIAASDWQLQIKSVCENARDEFNFIGINEEASLTWDALDQPEPPPIGEYISVYFPKNNWQVYPNNYTTDYRDLLGEGQTWIFEVRTNIRDAEAQIFFEGLENLPADLDAILVDEKLKVTRNLRTDRSYAFPTGNSGTTKSLKLVVGKSGYVSGEAAEFTTLPTSYVLDQNFPNPFNPATSIRYGLPEASNVTIKVLDVLGREVTTLLAGETREAGYHVINWNGRDEGGSSVASGLYFYQIITDTFSKTRKMLLVK